MKSTIEKYIALGRLIRTPTGLKDNNMHRRVREAQERFQADSDLASARRESLRETASKLQTS